MVRVIMHGCNGVMGQVITGMAKDMEGLTIVAGIDLKNDKENGYPVYASLEECKEEADVVVDFASPKAADHLMDFCAEKKLGLVLCTTGLSEEQIKKVKETAEKTAVLRSANMSLGVNLLLKLVQEAAKVLASSGFDIEIVEKHHNQKIDAPSGTAMALADAINQAMEERYHYVYDRSQVHEKREKTEIGIHAVRGGNIVGEHDVIFAGRDEVIELTHRATSREVRRWRSEGGKIPGRQACRSIHYEGSSAISTKNPLRWNLRGFSFLFFFLFRYKLIDIFCFLCNACRKNRPRQNDIHKIGALSNNLMQIRFL